MFARAVLAILALPGIVIGVIPSLLITLDPWRTDSFLAGYVVIGLGLLILFETIRTFYVAGHGTLAPWAPPDRVVRIGLYRFVRNPMYIGVLTTVAGLGLRFGSPLVAGYVILLAVCFHLNLVYLEEPRLARRFPESWPAFAAEVPRWIPRRPRS